MNPFEKVSRFAEVDLQLPQIETQNAAGYDLAAAEDIIIPPYQEVISALGELRVNDLMGGYSDIISGGYVEKAYTLSEMSDLTKKYQARPTLVSTGMKCKLAEGTYLELASRSSTPLKHWLVVANGVGVIDADYYNCEANEGEIFVQLINFSPLPIQIKKGDKIAQGIIKPYVPGDATNASKRTGGMGSTTK